MDEFWFNQYFREKSLRNYKKELSTAFYPYSHVVMFLEIAQVNSILIVCRVYKGHL